MNDVKLVNEIVGDLKVFSKFYFGAQTWSILAREDDSSIKCRNNHNQIVWFNEFITVQIKPNVI